MSKDVLQILKSSVTALIKIFLSLKKLHKVFAQICVYLIVSFSLSYLKENCYKRKLCYVTRDANLLLFSTSSR